MARIVVIDDRDSIAERLVTQLRRSSAVEMCQRAPQREDGFGGELSDGYAGLFDDQAIDTVIYAPPLRASNQMVPDLADAEVVFQQCAQAGIKKMILLSSAAVYGASPHNPGLISESRSLSRNGKNPIGGQWAELEGLAVIYLGEPEDNKLTILRPAAVPVRGGADYFSRLFTSRLAFALPGHDPSLQLLSPEDLARAVCCAVERSQGGVYNVAPESVIPLRAALRLTGAQRIPLARGMQRLARAGLAPLGLAHSIDQLDYIRYSWTISNQKIKSELGFAPKRSSAEALREFRAAIQRFCERLGRGEKSNN